MNVREDIVITPLAVTILPSGFDLVRVQRSIGQVELHELNKQLRSLLKKKEKVLDWVAEV